MILPIYICIAWADVAVLNAISHVIIRDSLASVNFIEERTEGFEAFATSVREWTPERNRNSVGRAPQDIVDAAYLYAHARQAMILGHGDYAAHHRHR